MERVGVRILHNEKNKPSPVIPSACVGRVVDPCMAYRDQILVTMR